MKKFMAALCTALMLLCVSFTFTGCDFLSIAIKNYLYQMKTFQSTITNILAIPLLLRERLKTQRAKIYRT